MLLQVVEFYGTIGKQNKKTFVWPSWRSHDFLTPIWDYSMICFGLLMPFIVYKRGDIDEVMVFSSLDFLFVFLPIFLSVYYIVPIPYRNWPLLLGSLAFYCYGAISRPWVILLFLGLNIMTYFTGLVLEKQGSHQIFVLRSSLIILFGSLLGFKYAGLFLGDTVLLPLGISFYSFQMAAYLMDIYYKKIKAEHSFWKTFTAMSMFPKLISGPLTPYGSLSQQLDRRTFAWHRFDYGLRDFVFGLGMKTLLADQIGAIWHQIQTIGFESISTPLAWLGLVSFSLQLYFDFFGYSLMAIGLGRMLGFRLPKNFVLPYMSCSMTEFWRCWHITLGKWFLDYVYIPLGGNREGKTKQVRNLLIVWLLTGIWHGSTPNFILWGVFIFALLAVEKLWLGKYLEAGRVWSHIYLIFTIMMSWMLFAIPDIAQIGCYFTRLFPFFGGSVLHAGDFIRLGGQYGLFVVIGIVVCTAWFMRWWDKIRQTTWGTMILFGIFWVAVYYLSAGLNDPFLYFSF
jgi:alginate O-acetyltransferase complex protein AlgI